MSKTIIHYIGAAVLISIIGAITLAGLGKVGPDWGGHVVDVGIGALAGIATGGVITHQALKPRKPEDPYAEKKDEDDQ